MDSARDTACAVGCPIRRSRDQRSLASPPGFSQRATSFIASQCQGIHQMPFFRASRATPNGKDHQVQQSSPFRRHFVRDPPRRSFAAPRPSRSVTQLASSQLSINKRPAGPRKDGRGNSVFCRDALPLRGAPPGLSAKRRFACRPRCSCAAPGVEVHGGGERARTVDLLLAKQALSQLSYTPVPEVRNQSSDIRNAASATAEHTPDRRSRRF